MVTGVVAACVALAACGVVLYAVRRSRKGAERRLQVLLERIDGHLDMMSGEIEQSVSRIVAAQRSGLPPLTLDFDGFLGEIVAEAAARTGADAVVLRVEGPGGRPVIATAGSGVGGELVERTFAPLDRRSFRTATIDWTYSPSGEPDDEQFHSALVAPLGPPAGIPGTIVAYSIRPNAFGAEHTAAVHDLLAETATGLANARRFADVEARLLLDPETGVANRRGYEVELGREVARARRTGRPLSVVLVSLSSGADTAPTGRPKAGEELARLVTRVTRRRDISCRRGDHEFAILLPETRESGAAVLTNRLREEAKRTLGASQPTITVGLVEWQVDESVEALESRAEAALASPSSTRRPVSPVPLRASASTTPSGSSVEARLVEMTDSLRRDVLGAIANEILDGRRFGRSLAVVALAVDELEPLSEVDREAGERVLGRVARQLSDSVGAGTVLRLSATEFVLVLPGATAHDAEGLLGSLHAPGEPSELAAVALTAGITELVERDGAETVFGRAEHALWQAGQAGRGTVVVAVPGRRPPSPQ